MATDEAGICKWAAKLVPITFNEMKLLWLPRLLLVSCAPGTGPVERKVIHQVDTIADLPFAKPDGVELLMDLHLPKGVVICPQVMPELKGVRLCLFKRLT